MSTDAEAEKLMASAHKHMKKSLLHKPNYNTAADEYEQAAKYYHSTKNLAKCKECYQSASECHLKAKNGYFAARAIHTLAQFLEELGKEKLSSLSKTATTLTQEEEEGVALLMQSSASYEEASKLFALEVKTDKQSECLGKAATALKDVMVIEMRMGGNKKNSAQQEYDRLMQEALANMELAWEAEDSRPYKLPEMYRNYIQQILRNSPGNCNIADLRAAVNAEKRMLGIQSDNSYKDEKNVFRKLNQPTNAAKAGLEIVVLCLSYASSSDSSNTLGDATVWATDELTNLGAVFGFCGSKEERCAGALLSAYNNRDAEELAAVLKNYHEFNFIMPDIARMSKKLKISNTASPAAGASGPTQVGGGIDNAEAIDPEEDMR